MKVVTDKSPDDKLSDDKRGVPVWMPLVGLLAAFLVALLVGASICPTLSALVIPPAPKLPPGTVNEISHESKAAGEDEWLYSTNQDGCAVALYYTNWLVNCDYSPAVACKNGKTDAVIGNSTKRFHVATCIGKQTVGNYSLNWTVYIDSGVPTGDVTVFRLIREVSN